MDKFSKTADALRWRALELIMRTSSLWLSDVEASRLPYPVLEGRQRTDVAIVGGGFVGLWSAFWLKVLDPTLEVAVVESGQCGGGASGLNGGFVMSWWPKIASLMKICGAEDAIWLADQTAESVAEIGKFARLHNIGAQYRMSGWLWTATTPVHARAWRGVLELTRRLGRGDVFAEIGAEEIAARTGSHVHLAGILERQNGTVHPAGLGVGLARVVSSMGVSIYENSRVTGFSRGSPVIISSARGEISASRLILATNAWAASIPELSRRFVCVGSAIIATPQIPDRLREIGWTGGESITDSQTTVNYYRTTDDGRIIFGKGGGRVFYTGEPGPLAFHDDFGIRLAEADFRRAYPMLRDVPIDQSWSGPIDRTYDSLPLLGTLSGAPHISYGVGWSGNGVNPSRIGGRILAGLALGRRERWTENGLVNRNARKFPTEPFRFVGGELVRAAMLRKDKAELAQRPVATIDKLLVRLAPSGLEDKN